MGTAEQPDSMEIMKTCAFAFLLVLGSTAMSLASEPLEFDNVFRSALENKRLTYRLLGKV